MAAITLAQAQAKLVTWMAADDAVASGRSYSIGSRTLTREDGDTIRKNITFWEAKVNALENGGTGGIRVRGLTLG